MTRQTFAIGDIIRQSHLNTVDDMTRLLRRFRENAIRDGIRLAQANKLAEALGMLITAVDFESPPIRDCVDVERRLDILVRCARDARQTLADWERGNATNLDL